MVYVTSGMGIVPIVHQIKAVLPTGSSSVKMVTVVWINDDSWDFDIFFRRERSSLRTPLTIIKKLIIPFPTLDREQWR